MDEISDKTERKSKFDDQLRVKLKKFKSQLEIKLQIFKNKDNF